MPLTSIKPEHAHELVERGAILIDIRSAEEYLREHITQAKNIALADLSEQKPLTGEAIVIFHCRSGNRTLTNAEFLSNCVTANAYILEGGLDSWKRSGFETYIDSSRPIEISRQVQIAAGTIILSGTLLGAIITPWFYAISGLVGAGLVFAGITGFCGLARLMMVMPWNKY